MISVAIVEDNPDVIDDLAFNLGKAGFQVLPFSDATALDAAIAQGQKWTLMILDIGLPGEDGFSIARRIRANNPSMGLIALTAFGRLEDRVQGLSEAFDLYLVKPVEIPELIAAVRAVARRALQWEQQTPIWRLEPIGPAVIRPDGLGIQLTPNEYQILSALAAAEGQTVSRGELMRAMGKKPNAYDPRALEVTISRLRIKMSPHEPLRAVRNQGYYFAARLMLARRDG